MNRLFAPVEVCREGAHRTGEHNIKASLRLIRGEENLSLAESVLNRAPRQIRQNICRQILKQGGFRQNFDATLKEDIEPSSWIPSRYRNRTTTIHPLWL